jgi:prefoldin subunit 5
MSTTIEVKTSSIKEELAPIHSKLEMKMYTFQYLNKTVEFLSAKYDHLLLQFRSINDKIQRCNQDIASIKKYLNDVNTCAVNAI